MVRVHRSLNMLSWSMFSFAAMVASIITLILTIGWVSAIALAAFVILCTTNTILGHLSRKQAHDALEKADKRLGVMTEIIDGIKAIKLCGVLIQTNTHNEYACIEWRIIWLFMRRYKSARFF